MCCAASPDAILQTLRAHPTRLLGLHHIVSTLEATSQLLFDGNHYVVDVAQGALCVREAVQGVSTAASLRTVTARSLGQVGHCRHKFCLMACRMLRSWQR